VTFALVTFGCRVNQADSFSIGRSLCRAGRVPAPREAADLIIVNTCAVTAAAEQDARQVIRRLARERPGARIVVTGCYARRTPEELARMPGVARVLDTVDLHEADWLAGPAGDGSAPGEPAAACPGPGFLDRTIATVMVQTGCSGSCSFCVVPATRGPGRSTPLAAVLAEIGALEEAGYREATLAGVHLGSWGRDLEPRQDLATLLDSVRRLPGRIRIRLSSIEPMDVTAEVEDLITGCPRFAPQFHLPVQHASDEVLARMGRPYRAEAVSGVFDRLRARMPHAALGTDVIAGFPGEREEDFRLLANWLARSPLSHVHVFPYSPRPGTAAASFTPRVAPAVARARVRALRAIASDLSRVFRRSQVGCRRQGITLADGATVLTDNGLKVRIPPGLPRNERVVVRLIDDGVPMRGELVAPEAWTHAERVLSAAV